MPEKQNTQQSIIKYRLKTIFSVTPLVQVLKMSDISDYFCRNLDSLKNIRNPP